MAYNLSGSSQLSAPNEVIGYYGIGNFTQTGGSNAMSNGLWVGGAVGGSAYNLSGNSQLSASTEYVGGTAGASFDAVRWNQQYCEHFVGKRQRGQQQHLFAGRQWVLVRRNRVHRCFRHGRLHPIRRNQQCWHSQSRRQHRQHRYLQSERRPALGNSGERG